MRKFYLAVILACLATLPARAQTGCSVWTQAQLLNAASDSLPQYSITPQVFRNLVCSLTAIGGGGSLGNTSIGGTLGVTGTTTLSGALNVAGTTTFSGNVSGTFTGGMRVNLGNYAAPIGVVNGSTATPNRVVVKGSSAAPDATGDAAEVLQAHVVGTPGTTLTSAQEVSVRLYGSAWGSHATALHAVCNDVATLASGSGDARYCEAVHGDAILAGPGLGSAYGGLFSVGTNDATVPWQYLIGTESVVTNFSQPSTAVFNPYSVSAGFNAGCGWPGTPALGCEVAYLLNPWGAAKWMYGVLAPAGTLDPVHGVALQADGPYAALIKGVGFTVDGSGNVTVGGTLSVTGAITASGSVFDTIGTAAQGSVLIHSATGWVPAPVGNMGQFLEAQGAGANVIWGSPTGSGTVNAGTSNQLSYYGSSGAAVSGLATANNGVLVTNGSGVPSISTTLPSGLTINLGSASGLPIASGLSGAGTGVLTALAANVTGSGGIVLGTSPTLVTPALGTPTALVLTSATGLPNSGLVNPSTTVNGQTCTLGAACTITSSAGMVTVGTTTIASGTSGHLLFNNSGVLGNEAISSLSIASSQVTGLGSLATLSAAPAGTLTGSTLASGVTGSSLTSLGTLTSLGVTGNTTVGGTLGSVGSASFGSTMVYGTLGATGDTTLGGALTATGGAVSLGSTTVFGNLGVTGNTTVAGQLAVASVLGSTNAATGTSGFCNQNATTCTLAAADCGTTVAFYNGASPVTVTAPAAIVPATGKSCIITIQGFGSAKVSVNGSAVTAATLLSASGYTGTRAAAGATVTLSLETVNSTHYAMLTGDGS
jgi:hypothetical protein